MFIELAGIWNPLLSHSMSDLIFLTREWQETWWDAYQPGELWVLTVHDDSDGVIAIAPWFVHIEDGERVVRTIGCVEVTDYVDIIAGREDHSRVLGYLAEYVSAHADHFGRINLCNIPAASVTAIEFPDRLRQYGFDADLVLQEVCPVIHLPDDFEDYLAMLDKKQRHEIRRKMRRAESETALRHIIIGDEDDFEAAVEEFLALMANSQPAKAEFLADPANERFFRALLAFTRACGWLRLSFLELDGVKAAAYCDLDYGGAIQVYNSGWRQDYMPHLSSGIVLLAYNIQDAIRRGRHLYDFLRGNETFKYRMGAQDTKVYMLRAQRR